MLGQLELISNGISVTLFIWYNKSHLNVLSFCLRLMEWPEIIISLLCALWARLANNAVSSIPR